MGETRPTFRRRSVIAGGLAAILPAAVLRARESPIRGRPPFATDIRLPGQLYAVVARPPVLGWSLAGFDARAAMQVRGVVAALAIAPWGTAGLAGLGGVAILARDTWSASKGREALSLDWRRDHAPVADRKRRGHFVEPETAEALVETPCATARAGAGRCEIWACLEDPGGAPARLADRLGLRRSDLVLHSTVLGGRPGQACDPEGAIEAALLSRRMGGAPVSLVWTREDDIPFRVRAGALVG